MDRPAGHEHLADTDRALPELPLALGSHGRHRGLPPRQGVEARCVDFVDVRARGARDRGGVRGVADRIRTDAMSKDYEFIDHSYDVVVVGAGGSGLRAT